MPYRHPNKRLLKESDFKTYLKEQKKDLSISELLFVHEQRINRIESFLKIFEKNITNKGEEPSDKMPSNSTEITLLQEKISFLENSYKELLQNFENKKDESPSVHLEISED